jgi:hypothetical protein
MLSAKDWYEIRLLHRSDRFPIKEIAWAMGTSREPVRSV